MKSQVLSLAYKGHSIFSQCAAGLVKGLIVLVKLTHDDKLQSQDTLL